MKNILVLFLFVSFFSNSQDIYESKSGVVLRTGDTLKLGQPVKISSSPLIATTGEWTTLFNMEDEPLKNMNFVNKTIIIDIFDLQNEARLIFELYGSQFYLVIDQAIDNGEVIISKNNGISKYDDLIKLKKLYDMQAITKDEYESEKKKILNNN